MDFDYLFKVILVGDAAVGKTSLVRRFAKGFCPAHEIPTIGVDVVVKTVDINGEKIKFKIWDSAGQERFKSVTTSYYRTSDAAIIAYAIDNEDSFNNLTKWMKDVEDYGKEDAVKVVVGNKSDLKAQRVVSQQEAIDAALMLNANAAFECSAKESDNVDYLFFCLAKELINKLRTQSSYFNNNTQAITLRYQSRYPSMDELSRPVIRDSVDDSFTGKRTSKRSFLKSLCNLN